jgi:SAM-dependent methyltransferase
MQLSTLDFSCNICGTNIANFPTEQLDREIISCEACGSTVRWRSIVHLLSLALFQKSIPLADFPMDKSIRGVGLSDSPLYAEPLAQKFSYLNTYIHQEPRMDIENPAEAFIGVHDFLISADVFEHVLPPPERAFENAFKILKPGGHLILTVPYGTHEETIEHFPDVTAYRIVEFDEEYVLVHRDQFGAYSLRTDLRFHGGQGDTLEMRVFSKRHILKLLADAGFTDVEVFEDPYLPWGIRNKYPWALPILAKRPL